MVRQHANLLGNGCLFSKLLPPLPYKLEISIQFQNSALKIDMNLVTTGHGDINAKEKINFDLYESDYEQKQYNIPLLLVLLNTSLGNKDPLVRNGFEKY